MSVDGAEPRESSVFKGAVDGKSIRDATRSGEFDELGC